MTLPQVLPHHHYQLQYLCPYMKHVQPLGDDRSPTEPCAPHSFLLNPSCFQASSPMPPSTCWWGWEVWMASQGEGARAGSFSPAMPTAAPR